MKIKPASHRILVQFHFPADEPNQIVLPKRSTSATAGTNRTLVEVLEIAQDVTECKVGDFLLLHEDALRNAVPISKEPPTALIHDGVILAIVLDDAQHVR